jgi:hypothetical protein
MAKGGTAQGGTEAAAGTAVVAATAVAVAAVRGAVVAARAGTGIDAAAQGAGQSNQVSTDETTLHRAAFCKGKSKNGVVISHNAVRSNFRKLLLLEFLGWLMGLEPTTTGITILDSTN